MRIDRIVLMCLALVFAIQSVHLYLMRSWWKEEERLADHWHEQYKAASGAWERCLDQCCEEIKL